MLPSATARTVSGASSTFLGFLIFSILEGAEGGNFFILVDVTGGVLVELTDFFFGEAPVIEVVVVFVSFLLLVDFLDVLSLPTTSPPLVFPPWFVKLILTLPDPPPPSLSFDDFKSAALNICNNSCSRGVSFKPASAFSTAASTLGRVVAGTSSIA